MSWQTGTEMRQPKFERVGEIWKRVKENVKGRGTDIEFPFGLYALDEITHGIPRARVTVIAARTTEGKTSLALQTAWNLADSGKMVAFVSLEDDREMLVEKLFCQVNNVRYWDLPKHPIISNNYDDPIEVVFDRIKLLVLDNFGWNVRELERVVSGLSPKPDIVFLDYVQMVEQRGKESEYEAISRFIRDVKIFTLREKIGMVLLSQINRQGARDRRPELYHLANCGRLEQVADLVLLLHTPAAYGEPSFDYDEEQSLGMKDCPSDYVEISVAKNKTGPRFRTAKVRFEGEKFRFYPWETSEVF